ncbi:glycosyltransferase family 2 protein [Brevundimonas variabilis]|uniref:Succinoglycan biosynthesis protein ExoO n=1 Tax=Brevundimonas variabilis TaxID=74312 RepID=A0A7W9FEH3_9CAUL|nr:glycosyltransferase [Brevundimonas variabilis]MBB5746337.1 succinoglycan biosynthesis protein ExoO [Brevundimonas variabilis]
MSPLVSVIMPARNVERYIDTAITSVRGQSLGSFELIVIDDGSSDQTARIVERHCAKDSRVRLISGKGRGPGAARNLGFACATGRWLAVVDSDDEILPDRLATLVDAAANKAHLVADNLVAFYDDGRTPHAWLNGSSWEQAHVISLKAFLLAGIEGDATDQPGYLKPLFDRLWLEQQGLRYDESLTIGEDYDLVARALAQGAIYQFIPEAAYRYRRHSASTSHRITPAQLEAMIGGFERLRTSLSENEASALDRRVSSLVLDQRFLGIVEDTKAGSVLTLFKAFQDPGLRSRLFRAAAGGLARRLRGS